MESNPPLAANYFGAMVAEELEPQSFDLDNAAIVAVTDSNGTIKYVNAKFSELSGYSRQELIGKNHRIVNSGYHSPAFFKNLWDTIKAGKIWKGEIRNKGKNGKYYWEDTTIVPFMDKNQNPIQYLSIRHEVNHDLQVQQAVASKFSALGEMAANISHEINNPLGVILGRCEMLMSHLDTNSPDPEHINKMVEHIEFTARRIENIVKSMRSFSTITDGQIFEPVLLIKLIHETINFVQQRFRDYDIDLYFSPLDPSLSIECNSTEISQIILNLLNNAFDAVQKLEVKWVKIETHERSDHIEISVTDSGQGISNYHRERLFDPFFSTKEKKYGTGLGLSISKGFAEKHKAVLEYDSLHKNTRFQLSLPKKQQ